MIYGKNKHHEIWIYEVSEGNQRYIHLKHTIIQIARFRKVRCFITQNSTCSCLFETWVYNRNFSTFENKNVSPYNVDLLNATS